MESFDLYDTLIIGAGAAGLRAALELAQAQKKIALIEARPRCGGRIFTLQDQHFVEPVELGAEFIHGHLAQTRHWLQQAQISFTEVTGSIWRKEKCLEKQPDLIDNYDQMAELLARLPHDMSIEEFLHQYLSQPQDAPLKSTLQTYAEGYYAADLTTASTFALRDELQKTEGAQYRITGGYGQLICYWEKELQKLGVPILLSQPVTQIHWQKGAVAVHTPAQILSARKLLATVPLGVLQSGRLQFVPDLPDKIAAARALGFGPVIKILLQFRQPFWMTLPGPAGLHDLSFLFSGEQIPTWWTQHPHPLPLLTGWLAGPHASRLAHHSEEEILQIALTSLARIFNLQPAALAGQLSASRVVNWAQDPFSCGAYSFDVVGGNEKKRLLKAPVEQTLFFAREALYEGIEIGTVEAALVSGLQAAAQILEVD